MDSNIRYASPKKLELNNVSINKLEVGTRSPNQNINQNIFECINEALNIENSAILPKEDKQADTNLSVALSNKELNDIR